METQVISATEIPKTLSYEYNCRNPSKTSRAYRKMRDQLRANPAAFVELNSGVVIANGKYVLDGAHTLLAIQDAIREGEVDAKQVHVRVTWMRDLSKEQMAERSVGLNTKVTPPLRGEKWLLGHWDAIEAKLDEKLRPLYRFKPGTAPEARYEVDFLVALLHAWQERSPERAYSSKGVIVRLYTPEKYQLLLPLLNVAVDWYSRLYEDLVSEKKMQSFEGVHPDREVVLPNGKRIKGMLPEAYVWPVFSAFHTLAAKAIKAGTGHKQFRAQLDEVWAERRSRMVNKLVLDYRENGASPTRLGKDSEAYLHQVVAAIG
jgi:hypothetical protein